MRNLIRMAATAGLAVAVVGMVAGPASGHQLDRAQITCAIVSGTFHDFGVHDHPIVWQVQIGNSAAQTVATLETPHAFVGSGSASADISTLTGQLAGTTATVQAFATWPGGQSATTSASLTCGVPTTREIGTPTPAPSVAGVEAVAPAAVAVPAAARFTG